jgi:hypothetical protein
MERRLRGGAGQGLLWAFCGHRVCGSIECSRQLCPLSPALAPRLLRPPRTDHRGLRAAHAGGRLGPGHARGVPLLRGGRGAARWDLVSVWMCKPRLLPVSQLRTWRARGTDGHPVILNVLRGWCAAVWRAGGRRAGGPRGAALPRAAAHRPAGGRGGGGHPKGGSRGQGGHMTVVVEPSSLV